MGSEPRAAAFERPTAASTPTPRFERTGAGSKDLRNLATKLNAEPTLEMSVMALNRAAEILETGWASFVDNVVRDNPILDAGGKRLVETAFGWPGEIPDWWYGGGLVRIEPDFQHCREASLPFLGTFLRPGNDALTEPQARMRDRFWHYGVSASVHVPVHLPNGVCGAVVWCGDSGIAPEVVEELWPELMGIAHSFMRALEISRANPGNNMADVKLTSRQIECAYWAALGKTMAETAAILSISVHTVREHLEEASRRLNATNVTHMVSLCWRHGIIRSLQS